MSNLIDYVKDKIYYILGATVVIILLIIILSSCSGGGNSYSKIEEKMEAAAKKYYETRKNKLPKENDSSVQVTIGTLIDAELLKEIKDPKNKNNTCSGYVQVKKVDNNYVYIPFLTCKGNYEPKYLSDVVKDSKLDEYGNGVYEVNGEYVYRGEDVNNYITFNNQTWRIIKVDKDGDIELMYYPKETQIIPRLAWDTSYNAEKDDTVGNTSDYFHTNIRKELQKWYDDNFEDSKKAMIVSKNICTGRKKIDDDTSIDIECSATQPNEKVGMLRVSDYKIASLDNNCVRYDSKECINRNYLSSSENIYTWLLTSVGDNTYEVYYLDKKIDYARANVEKRVLPIIYLTKDTIIKSGTGKTSDSYIIK